MLPWSWPALSLLMPREAIRIPVRNRDSYCGGRRQISLNVQDEAHKCGEVEILLGDFNIFRFLNAFRESRCEAGCNSRLPHNRPNYRLCFVVVYSGKVTFWRDNAASFNCSRNPCSNPYAGKAGAE